MKRTDADRRIRQADRLARILSVLRLIQGRGKWDAKSIAKELAVDQRTVYRDLKALEFAGVPFFFDKSAGSYRVREDYRFPVADLTDEEVIGLAVASAVSAAPNLNVGGSAAPTSRKLAAASKQETQRLLADVERIVSVLGLQFADHSGKSDIIRLAQQSLLQGKMLKGLYNSPYQGEPTELLLHPIRLCLIKNAWYLIANTEPGAEPKTYRIARFESAELVKADAEIPDNFDLKEYLGNAWTVFRGAKSFDIRLDFTCEVARIVTETKWHHTQSEQWHDDGSVTLEFTVDGLEEICNWLIPWSPQARVDEPQELRQMLIAKLTEGLKKQQQANPKRKSKKTIRH